METKSPQKTKIRDTKLIPLETYLFSKGVKPQHFPGMIAFAKGMKVGTKTSWDNLFSTY